MSNVMKGFLKAADFKDKVVFWGMDGVIIPYRFNGTIGISDTSYKFTKEEFSEGVLSSLVPSKHILNIMSSIDAKSQIVISCYMYPHEDVKRDVWVHEHLPKIKDTLMVHASFDKAKFIKDYCDIHDISIEDIIFIDDNIEELRKAELADIESWHVSSVMDFYEQV